jgi:hypothetical protein
MLPNHKEGKKKGEIKLSKCIKNLNLNPKMEVKITYKKKRKSA